MGLYPLGTFNPGGRLPMGKRLRTLSARFEDQPTASNDMVPDQTGILTSAYFANWEDYRRYFNVPDDHPVFGTSAYGSVVATKNIDTNKIAWNTAALTGLYYKYPGRITRLAPGTYDMTCGAGGVTTIFVPVIWWPPITPDDAQGLNDGTADGEIGPMFEGSGHYRATVLDWSGMGGGFFAGPQTGQTYKQQAAAIDVPSRADTGGKRGIVSELYLCNLRLKGPREPTGEDTRYITGLRLEIESGLVERVRTLRWPDIGVYLPRRRYDTAAVDDHTCFVRLRRILTNSSGRIGCCLGHRALEKPWADGDYAGDPNYDLNVIDPITGKPFPRIGYLAEHITTIDCDFRGPIAAQVWVGGWTDRNSIFGASLIGSSRGEVGLRLVGFRGTHGTVAHLSTSRVEKGPEVASISLWGQVEADWFGAQIVPGGYSSVLTPTISGSSGNTVVTASLATGIMIGDVIAIVRNGGTPTEASSEHVVTNVVGTSVTIAPGLPATVTNGIARKVNGYEAAGVRVERRPPTASAEQGSVELRIHGGNVNFSDKKYAVLIQARRGDAVSANVTAVLGNMYLTLVTGRLDQGNVIEVEDVAGMPLLLGPLTVGGPAGTIYNASNPTVPVDRPVNATITSPTAKAWVRTANGAPATINLAAGRNSISDAAVPGSKPFYTAFASSSAHQLTMNAVPNEVRRWSAGKTQLAALDNDPADAEPIFKAKYDGSLEWGPGESAETDISLARSSAGQLNGYAFGEHDGEPILGVYSIPGQNPATDPLTGLPEGTYRRGQIIYNNDVADGAPWAYVIITQGTVTTDTLSGTINFVAGASTAVLSVIPNPAVVGRWVKGGTGSSRVRIKSFNGVNATLYAGGAFGTSGPKAVTYAPPVVKALPNLV